MTKIISDISYYAECRDQKTLITYFRKVHLQSACNYYGLPFYGSKDRLSQLLIIYHTSQRKTRSYLPRIPEKRHNNKSLMPFLRIVGATFPITCILWLCYYLL